MPRSEAHKKWAKINSAKVKAYRRLYYEKNRVSESIKRRIWGAANPGKDTATSKRYWTKHFERKLFLYARRASKDKGLPFNIEMSDIIIPERCPVFGFVLDRSIGGGTMGTKRCLERPSLDRIDPLLGYVKGNIWVISWKANYLKLHNTLTTLKALVRAIEAHQAA